MNERIKELAEQAGFYVTGSKIYIPSTSEDITTCQTKFAELIVRECLSVGEDVANANCNGPWFDGYVSGVEEVNRRIKQHFGVEE